MLENTNLQKLVRVDILEPLHLEVSKEDVKKYINLGTAEYYLGGIEILLVLRFLTQFFSGFNTDWLTKIFLAITFPLAAPFYPLLGMNYSSGIARSEATTLLAMFMWPVIIWSAIVYFKRRREQHHLA